MNSSPSRALLFLTAFLMPYPIVFAQKGNTPHSDARSSFVFRKIENNAFTAGEELNYDVNFGFITAGKARMAIPRYEEMNGRKSYYIEFTVRSSGFFDNFYNVRDRYESYMDVEGLFPWKFIQTIREGSYKHDYSAQFDHAAGKAYTATGEHPIEPYVQDVLSAFYYMRTYNYTGFRPGQKIILKNFAKDTTYELTIKYLGRQTIEVEAGTFNTILLQPIMKEGGLFKSSGRIIVWVTDDEKRMPVQVDAQIPIGSITSELTSYKGLPSPVKARVK